MNATTFPICGHCGVVALSGAAACAVCERPFPPVRVEAPLIGCWVAIRARFKCRGCGFQAPIDQLDVDGAIDCVHCGLRQAFEASSWRSALEFAHAVGDLAGPLPEGNVSNRFVWIGDSNPYATVGVTQAFREFKTNYEAGREFFLEAGPGFPSCKKCAAAFVVRVEQGRVHTDCPRCGDSADYQLPPRSSQATPAIVAVVADESRTDRMKANVGGDGQVMAIRCPGCGAPLSPEGDSRSLSCPFCKALSFVPGKVMARALGRTPKPETWWVLFQGPSRERKKLEAPNASPQSVAKAMKKLLKGQGQMSAAAAEALLKQKQTDVSGRGIEDAPEMKGVNWPQLILSAALICLFLGLADLIFE